MIFDAHYDNELGLRKKWLSHVPRMYVNYLELEFLVQDPMIDKSSSWL